MINEVKHLGRMLNARDGFDLGIFQVRIPARCLLSTHNSHRSCNLTVESQTGTPWTFPDAEVAWHAPALGYQLHLWVIAHCLISGIEGTVIAPPCVGQSWTSRCYDICPSRMIP